jgi:hypothetical protein
MLRRRRHVPARDHGLDILAGRRPAAGSATMDPEDLLATPPVTDDLGAQLAARPPRATLPKLTLALAAAVLIGAGFLGGLTAGKSSASTGSGGLPAGLASGFPGGGGLPSGGTRGGSAQGAGGGGFAGGGTVGTIKLVDGHTIYVQTFSGSIIRVSTSGSTRIQVSATGTVKDLQPGQAVVVQGSKRSDGSVAATSVSQSSLGGGGGGG